MSKKQIGGLIAAALVFVFVSASSMITKNYTDKINIMNALSSANSSYYPATSSYVGVIDVTGTIMPSTQTSVFSTSTGYDHNKALDCIDEMMDASNNKGILLYLDTPGGTVYESDELYLKLMEYREETGRPVYAYMTDMACSGGYYIAMASDKKIYANRNAWTGSIGVIISITNLSGLYDMFGVEEINIKSGPNKDMGSSGNPLSDEHRALFQALVDESYEQFVGIVAEGRGMDINTVKPLADGRIYTAKQALEVGLIDGIMGYDEFLEVIYDDLGSVKIAYVENESSILEQFLYYKSEPPPAKSDAEVLQALLSERNGVLMYYAELAG